jgi:hypothetical protein
VRDVNPSSSKEAERKLAAEKGGVMYFEEELRPVTQNNATEALTYHVGTGIAVSKVCVDVCARARVRVCVRVFF